VEKVTRERKIREGTGRKVSLQGKPPRLGIPPAGSAGGMLKQYSTLYAAARLWLASAIMFFWILVVEPTDIRTVPVRDL
jgi:hypothetical protein